MVLTDTEYWLKKNKVPKNLSNIIDKNLNQNDTVLDLGSAGGRLCRYLKSKTKNVYAIDKNFALIRESSKIYPDINFIHGDFSVENYWKKINKKLDFVVSDCAIRKDYIDLKTLSKLCYKYANKIILRIQNQQDLDNILNKHQRENLFYSENEIKSYFVNINIIKESYVQKFSSKEYLEDYLKKINIKANPKNLAIKRCYFIISGKTDINRGLYQKEPSLYHK